MGGGWVEVCFFAAVKLDGNVVSESVLGIFVMINAGLEG